MELNEKKFIAGFNSGYLLAKYEPQMLTVLLKSVQPINAYIAGISFGQKEYELGKSKSHLDELRQVRQINRDDFTKEKD